MLLWGFPNSKPLRKAFLWFPLVLYTLIINLIKPVLTQCFLPAPPLTSVMWVIFNFALWPEELPGLGPGS